MENEDRDGRRLGPALIILAVFLALIIIGGTLLCGAVWLGYYAATA